MSPGKIRREGWMTVGRVTMLEEMIRDIHDTRTLDGTGVVDQSDMVAWLRELRAREVVKAGELYNTYRESARREISGR